MRPTMAQRNDHRATPLDAITLAQLNNERRAAFGRGSLATGPQTRDPVSLERPKILPRPLLPERTHGIDMYL